jgi:hypothetical protein
VSCCGYFEVVRWAIARHMAMKTAVHLAGPYVAPGARLSDRCLRQAPLKRAQAAFRFSVFRFKNSRRRVLSNSHQVPSSNQKNKKQTLLDLFLTTYDWPSLSFSLLTSAYFFLSGSGRFFGLRIAKGRH